jgi:hypothetical protein
MHVQSVYVAGILAMYVCVFPIVEGAILGRMLSGLSVRVVAMHKGRVPLLH